MSSGRSKHAPAAFTLVEALLAFGVAFVLMVVLYTLLVSSRRGMVRGEGKLEYIGEANLLFQSLKMDVQALRKAPAWNEAAKELKLDILRVERKPYRAVPERVTYRLESGTIHRRADLTGAAAELEHRRFGLDKLKAFKVTPGALRSAPNITVNLRFEIEADNAPTDFSKVLFLKNLLTDKTWNPLPEP
ncbi:MAG: hypothetical protein HY303_20205 [Candidatus Wallbacteria bacterium]|nr:hypothetical protein [Candidatus Wallbacteria bacterium]